MRLSFNMKLTEEILYYDMPLIVLLEDDGVLLIGFNVGSTNKYESWLLVELNDVIIELMKNNQLTMTKLLDGTKYLCRCNSRADKEYKMITKKAISKIPPKIKAQLPNDSFEFFAEEMDCIFDHWKNRSIK